MALLFRGRRSPSGARRDGEARMSVVEHLEDLRRALIISVAGWLVATIVAYIFWQPIFRFLINRAGLSTTGVYFLGPTGGFFLSIRIAFVVGLVGAAPIIFWQIWWFVSPGLHQHEKRLILPLIGATSVFFLLGVGFALFSLPLFMKILTGSIFVPTDLLHYFPEGDQLLGFIFLITIAFGLVFELPIVLYALGMMRIISSRWLYRNRVYWVVGLGILANFMTPGVDPITPLLVFVPLYIFWEATALILKLSGR
jgi:sec-independent protein translocase protein TatC